MLLPTAYFPNIQYMSKFFTLEDVMIELHEHYIKKTYRNRCDILAANGKLSLSVPIIKAETEKAFIKDVKIDYKTDWQKQHFKSIESAYQPSPFYEYIIPDFLFVFETQTPYLIDLNSKILDVILSYINPSRNYQFSETYTACKTKIDYRTLLSPKETLNKQDPYFLSKNYYQTFSDKFDFIENLSILDLLFNEGPRSAEIIKRSIYK
jgi:dipeptidase